MRNRSNVTPALTKRLRAELAGLLIAGRESIAIRGFDIFKCSQVIGERAALEVFRAHLVAAGFDCSEIKETPAGINFYVNAKAAK
jgi:hypothetical protein